MWPSCLRIPSPCVPLSAEMKGEPYGGSVANGAVPVYGGGRAAGAHLFYGRVYQRNGQPLFLSAGGTHRRHGCLYSAGLKKVESKHNCVIH